MRPETIFGIVIVVILMAITTLGYYFIKHDNYINNYNNMIRQKCSSWCGSQKVLLCDFPDGNSDGNNPQGVWCQEEGNIAKYYTEPRNVK